MEGLVQRIRSTAQRIRSSISAQSAGVYANMADGVAQWWRHPYAKPAAAAAAGFIISTVLVIVSLSVALGHCKTPGPCTPEPTPAGTTPEPETPCGTRVPVGPRIVNGDDASPHSSPWMGFVQDGVSGHLMANAALIHKYFVVTDRKVSPGDVVVLGAHNRSDTSEVTRQTFMIEAVFVDPNLSADLPWGGMRLAKLSRPVNFNKYINRVCPPKRHFIPADGSCMLTGWGWMTPYTRDSLLQEGSLRIIPNDQCKRDMPDFLRKYITNATFCTAVDEISPEWGPFGSPLVCEQEQGVFGVYGVNVPLYGPSSHPTLFHNVTVMDSWMDELFSQYN